MNNTVKLIIDLIDRLVGKWIFYRAGQSSIINKAQGEVLEQIKKRDEIESRNDNTDFNDLMRNSGSIG